MEKDELKNLVESRKQEFEVYEFDQESSWGDIANKLDEANKSHVNVPIRYLWRVVAVLVVSLGVTFYMAWNSFTNGNSNSIASIELAEADAYYGTLINAKVIQIKNSSPQLDPEIFQDIDALDIAFTELKEDLKDNVDNEEVVSAMMLNYKIKLEILEKILNEMDIENEEAGS